MIEIIGDYVVVHTRVAIQKEDTEGSNYNIEELRELGIDVNSEESEWDIKEVKYAFNKNNKISEVKENYIEFIGDFSKCITIVFEDSLTESPPLLLSMDIFLEFITNNLQ